eukprot:CAMPEP_0177166422 /NCGR_PEP_ID=MMETSP0367-20130122/8021_1 /TAXON_ID=447022 ORGANISM="Scrippsiella hangoei-like, Strain SHHI-4" /NCGR_SAMPLE_ID=MMETSP0367 /ASSEMBLY_ACC=CAM_ASM_000362 /LENGTH=32 /DNA_ID= /DNA_START= /DNA_END= /DNA_ORIENTATION=
MSEAQPLATGHWNEPGSCHIWQGSPSKPRHVR